jgi:RimJ/RimL family protein N-acetyltransferase
MTAPVFGDPVPGWTAPPAPGPDAMEGRFVRLERLDPDQHAADLFAANRADDAIWDYMPYGPFADAGAYCDWVAGMAALRDPFFYALRDLRTGRAAGVASFLRITPEMGTIEVGHIALSPALQRSPAATEAMALMMGWAFGAGYRRYEWKCNALNLPSRRAAERLGLSYEGVFRQAAVVKGRNRDTAWFAAIDKDWPALRAAFDQWCDPSNFDEGGRQKTRLSDLTRPVLVSVDPTR